MAIPSSKPLSNAAFKKKAKMRNRLPVRPHITEVEFWRKPTAGEIRFGHGATHYKTFPIEQCSELYEGKRYLKKWIVCPDDGLRYYR